MQKSIFLDYIIGEKKLKLGDNLAPGLWEDLRFLYKALDKCGGVSYIPKVLNDKRALDIGGKDHPGLSYMIKWPAEKMMVQCSSHLEQQRVVLTLQDYHGAAFVADLWRSQKADAKTYILSSNLENILKDINLNISSSFLPKSFSCNLVFNDLLDGEGEEVLNVTVLRHQNSGVDSLYINYVGNQGGVCTDTTFLDKEEKPLEALFADMPAKGGTRFKNPYSFYKRIINTILYIFGGNEEFETTLNEFSTKKRKREAQKKIFTTLPHIKLNRTFEELSFVSDESYSVSGHFRWQPCGPKRSKVKLIFIRPHTRTMKRPFEKELFHRADVTG